ncbi:Putative RNA-binding protein 15B [Toxocara canis]|uniref:Putative RNA-binding protein 15B n=1 Tax=Toxocara canis TaxID=6265 RepID=A0A0B2VKC5_TOXCA|nr:Putative RNA-binding protein 15B [Toxocara canis]
MCYFWCIVWNQRRVMGTRYGGGGVRGDRRNQRFPSYGGPAPRQSRPVQRLPIRREASPDLETNLSSFYRDRFGSHSPEEYMNLRLSHLDSKLSKDEIKDILEHEFRRFAPFEIKVVRNPGDEQRLAYVNFERGDAARTIRHTMLPRLQKLLGRRLHLDPAGIIRDQEGKYIPDRYNRALQAERERDRKEPVRRQLAVADNSLLSIIDSQKHKGTREIQGKNIRKCEARSTKLEGKQFIRKSPSRQRRDGDGTWNLKEDDSDATRTLFVGNLPADIRESELRRVFEKYGRVEDVDIKTPPETNAAYAFILFQTLEQSMNAKASEHDRPIRPGTSRCKIGYGKSQPSNRLWIGGLGPWTSADYLAKEFDRYGLIDRLDYEEGADYAFIRFADQNAAMDACRAMKGFPLGGRDRCIIVDFAKDDQKEERKRRRSRSIEVASRKRRGPRTPPESPPGSPSDGDIDTVDELERRIAPTWQGFVVLKKTEYAIRLHRISGTEHLLQKLLREPSDGSALKLHITQRLPLASQEALEERLINSSRKQLSLMIAIACDRSIRPLVNYLCEKEAAGVVTVPGGVLYVFSPSNMADRLIHACAPRVNLLTPECSHLLFALALKASSSTPSNGS